MRVIFLQHVLHVAKKWEVKDVSSGYASNFLFPKKLAQAYTKDIEKKIHQSAQKKESDRRMLLWEKENITKCLEGEVFSFELPGSGEKLYGSIHPRDVAAYISKKYHIPLSKKHIDFWGVHSSFKTLGDHQIYIDLWANYAVKSTVRLTRK